jgi:mannosylglycerate hydrolase
MAMASRLTELHVVTHTHWDREWYHTAETFRQRLVRLVDELLETPPVAPASFLLDGQAVVIEDYLAVRPEQAEAVSRLLKEGVLEAGPWYVLADELIPGGEALVRNLLHGRASVRRLGGEPPAVLYCPDSFGHPAVGPDLAVGFGYSLIVLWRGFGGRRTSGTDVVRWHGSAGGSAIVYHLPPDGYEFGSSLPIDAAEATQRWLQVEGVMAPRSETGVAILLNGADHHARQIGLDAALEALANAASPVRVMGSSLATASRAVVDAASRLHVPDVTGELRDSYGYTWTLQGTLGTRAAQKRRNARAEQTLVRDVEPWMALTAGRGDGAPRALLDVTWKTLLKAHPHDTLCGTSTDAVAAAFDARLTVVEEESKGLRDDTLRQLLGHDAARARVMFADWRPAVVIRNSVARRRGGVVELALQSTVASIAVGPGSASRQGAHLEQGEWRVSGVPLQILTQHDGRALTESPRAYPRADTIRGARAVGWISPLGGYEVQTVAHAAEEAPVVPNPVTATESALDNGLVRVEVDAVGRVTFIDLRSGRRMDGLVQLERSRDDGDLYTPAIRESQPPGPSRRIGLVHAGPLRGAIGMELDVGVRPHAHCTRAFLELDAHAASVRIRMLGDNQLPDQRTRLRFTLGQPGDATLADAAFHPVVREDIRIDTEDAAMEHVVPTAPLHRWVARLSGDHTAVLVSDGLAEYESSADGAVHVTLVRSVGELSRHDLPERPGHAGWPVRTPDAQSVGPYEACFAVQLFGPDSGDVRDAIEQFAEDVLHPLVGETLRSNLLPPHCAGGLELSGAGLAFSAAYPARDKDWIVLRCVNRRDSAVRGSWTLARIVHEAVIARLDETPMAMAEVADGVIRFTAEPRAIITIVARVA